MGYRKRPSNRYTPRARAKSARRQRLLVAPGSPKEQVRLIRQRIKRECPTLSVRMQRGTGYGWVGISGSATEWGNFTDEEKEALERLGLRYGGNFAVISPEDRKYYLRSWGVIC